MKNILLFVCCALCISVSSRVPSYTLYVEAGDFDRYQTVVTVALPKEALKTVWQARTPEGVIVPVQQDANGEATFVLDHLSAGEWLRLQLEPAPETPMSGIQVETVEGTVRLGTDAYPIVQYHAATTSLPRADVDPIYHRDGYLHPVYTPGGRIVTDDYPPAHIHHHGIWAAWTKTAFQGRTPDFWNMGEGTGKVEVVALDATWEGPVHGGLQARHRYLDLAAPEPVVALHETWELRVYNIAPQKYHVFDLTLTQNTATDSILTLPTHRYGGVGFRGHRDWNGEENTDFLTSAGKDRSDGHATRARWCHVGGIVDGEPVGIAILGHPDNYEAPQPMRIHPTEPFFNFAPTQAGDMAIVPGIPYEVRYRFVVYDGASNPEEVDRLWNDYAYPPVARIEF